MHYSFVYETSHWNTIPLPVYVPLIMNELLLSKDILQIFTDLLLFNDQLVYRDRGRNDAFLDMIAVVHVLILGRIFL